MNLLNLRPAFTPHLMISIISCFFFIIYLGYMSVVLYPIRPNALRLFIACDHDNHDSTTKTHIFRKAVLDSVERRKKITYNFQGQVTLDSLKKEIDYLLQNNRESVLAVSFNTNNTYGDFVRLINFLVIHRIKRYAFVDNTMYVFMNRYEDDDS